ncbi:MAG TPA: AI-2E family transporter [Hyphomonadaceae bacterium]|nr:AI-2E family transporter [Hyphomonadaceae bacterium]
MQQPVAPSSRTYMTAGVWIIATVAIGIVLAQGAKILAPFALAVFIWLVMEGFARAIRKPFPNIPDWIAHLFAITVVVLSIIVFIGVVRGAILEFAGKSKLYETHINDIIKQVYSMLGLTDAASPTPIDVGATPPEAPGPVSPGAEEPLAANGAPLATAQPPTISELFYSDATMGFAQTAANSVSGLVGDIVLIFIYVAFQYVTSATFSRKLDRIFVRPGDRDRARVIGAEVRRTMEQYLWVQTALSIITTSLTYVTLLIIGLDNALFWAVVIFVLNYIPTIGSIIATVLPAIFALVQPVWPVWMPDDPLLCALIVFLGISVWQFVIGNFLGPRMTSNSLNLSALVVLLSLAVWGALWGPAGMFLSAPLTVLVMIVLAQIPGARWIAVLMSADGNPGEYAVKHEPQPHELRHDVLSDI